MARHAPRVERERSKASFHHAARRLTGIALALGLLVLPACRKAPAPAQLDPSAFNPARALDEAKALTRIGTRPSGSPGAQRAAEHLRARLKASGVDAAVDIFEEDTPDGTMVFRNVLGVIPGADDAWIILGAHYDTKSGLGDDFQAANDSSSGAATLLALAGALRSGAPLRHNLMLAFFDGEESRRSYGPHDGLHGSRRLARTLQDDGRAARVLAVIVLDMVGDRDLSITIPRNSTPRLMTAFFQAAEAEGVREKFALFSGDLLDDHQPFFEAGMPAIDIIDFEYGSAPGKNDYWHTSADALDKLSAASLGSVGRVTMRVLNGLNSSKP